MAKRLQDKVALVTGGGSGIGAATARRFASEGARVALIGRRIDRSEAVARQIAGMGGTAIAIVADISAEEDAERAVARTSEALGGLDIAFNNAGIIGNMVPITQMSAADFDQVLSVNLRGAWLMARAQIRAMLETGSKGSIIGTSSFVASASTPGTSAYAASKAGLEAMTRALAMECGPHGIRVNAIAPGVTETEMFSGSGVDDAMRRALADHAPLRRLGQGEDMAAAALWLASDESAFVTGQTILVDGGIALPGMR